MPRYDFDVPRARGLSGDNNCPVPIDNQKFCVKDFILHMLLARVTTEGGDVVEFETIFNPLVNALDIDVPSEILDIIETVNVGPNLQRFLDWLNGLSDVVFDTIQFNPNIAAPDHSEGLVFYDSANKTLAIYSSEEDILLQVGETWLPVHNHSGSTIVNGAAVRLVADPDETRPQIALAQADAEGTSFVIGLATHDIEVTVGGDLGFVTTFGIVRGIDTSGFASGDQLWLSPFVAGGVTNINPSPPNIDSEIGICVVSDSVNGEIFVNPRFSNYYTKDQIDNIVASIVFNLDIIPNLLRVVQTGGSASANYITIEEAIDEINGFIGGPNEASATNRYVIEVTPGTYVENPLTIPSFVSINGLSDDSTIAEAFDDNLPLFTMDDDSQIHNLTCDGPANSDAIFISNNMAEISHCDFDNCSVAIHVDGAGAEVGIDSVEFKPGVVTGIRGTNGSDSHILNSVSAASVTHVFGDGGSVHVMSMHIEGGTNGLYANNGGEVIVIGAMIHDTTNVCRTGASGTNSITGSGVVSEGSSTWDVLQEKSDGMVRLTGCSFSANKMSFINTDNILLGYDSNVSGDEGYELTKELHVGLPEQGRESVFGGGDSYTRGMLVYTENTSNVFVDVSTIASSDAGSTFTFTGTAANNAIYISSDLQVTGSGDFLTFLGIKSKQTIAAVLGAGNFVAEYYSTLAGDWAPFNIMAAGSNSPYTQYANSLFERVNSSEQIRFENVISDWGKNDPPLTGTTRYWVRFRIENAITTAPVFEQFKLHTNRTEINADGFVEFMGLARKLKTLESINIGNTTPIAGKSPGNTNVDFSATINFSATANTFLNNNDDGFGQALPIPEGLDTSLDLEYVVRWCPSTDVASGVVALDVVVGQSAIGTVLDGTNPETITTDTTITTANTANEIYESRFSVQIPSSSPGDGVFFVLQRQASGVTGATGDTYAGSIYIINIELLAMFWH